MMDYCHPVQEYVMTPEFARIRRHLARRDPVMRRVIKQVGPCTLRFEPDHFRVLVGSIVAQQISTVAARTIQGRLVALLNGRLTPRAVLKRSHDELRGVGLSRAKALAVRDLAEKCAAGDVPLRRLAGMSDEEVIEALVPVRGIGRWTAEMFLIFSLGRLDVLPVADLGLRAGVRREHALPELPDRDAVTRLTEPWRPFRSIGTWYMWRSISDAVPQS
jgi:DNA-3-methyladenine glycosylase II